MTVQYRNEERSFLMPGSLIGVGAATPQKHSTDLTVTLHCCNIERGCTTLNGYLWIRVLVKQLPHNVVESFPRCRSASAIEESSTKLGNVHLVYLLSECFQSILQFGFLHIHSLLRSLIRANIMTIS